MQTEPISKITNEKKDKALHDLDYNAYVKSKVRGITHDLIHDLSFSIWFAKTWAKYL